MANSLTDWLAAKVPACISLPSPTRATGREESLTLLDDVAFTSGPKVQIHRFFTAQQALDAERQLPDVLCDGAKDGPKGDDELGGLWAVVGDRTSSVYAHFSQHCVSHFNSTRSRELISLSGAIVSLKSFRPSISWVPSLLEGNQRSCGPFAPAVPLEATLLLQIESFEVLGSINEVIFWDTTALQATLLQHARPEAKLFQRWFRRVEKAMIREHKRAERVASNSKLPTSSASQAVEERSSEGGPSGSAASAALSSLPPPPPFQQPAWPGQTAKRQRDSSSGLGSSAPSTQSKRAKLDAAWGDFSLSHLDDEFGLDAAASQLLDRHTQGQDSALDDSTERLFPSLSSYDSLLGAEVLSDEDGEREIDGNAAIDVQSSAATLPPTYPLNVVEAGAAQAVLGEGSTVRPPSITDTTSLPFSFLLDGEAEAAETEAEGAATPEHDDRQQGDADATHAGAGFHSKHTIGPTIHPWKTVRRVSAEQRKDYERRYRSQMHNITD